MFNHRRLNLARKRRRLTSKELAKKAGLSPVTVTRIERANNEPDPESIEKLSGALKFPKEFFLGDDFDELSKDSASFRSLTSMTAKERDAALSAGALAYMLSDWVSERFNLPEADLLDLSHESNPQNAAIMMRQYWGLGEQPVSNMMRLLESKGVMVFSLAENTKNVDAFSCWRNDVPYIFVNTFKSAEHGRFDTAHELGHLVLHKHGARQGRVAEKEANIFASFFLMPRSDILSKIPCFISINQLIQAKKRWQVSLAALGYRLHKIGIMSDWQYRTFCIQINTHGYSHNEPEEIPREKSLVWEKVFTQLWSERITKKDIANDLHIPTEEIENLVFGLVSPNEPLAEFDNNYQNMPKLRLINNK